MSSSSDIDEETGQPFVDPTPNVWVVVGTTVPPAQSIQENWNPYAIRIAGPESLLSTYDGKIKWGSTLYNRVKDANDGQYYLGNSGRVSIKAVIDTPPANPPQPSEGTDGDDNVDTSDDPTEAEIAEAKKSAETHWSWAEMVDIYNGQYKEDVALIIAATRAHWTFELKSFPKPWIGSADISQVDDAGHVIYLSKTMNITGDSDEARTKRATAAAKEFHKILKNKFADSFAGNLLKGMFLATSGLADPSDRALYAEIVGTDDPIKAALAECQEAGRWVTNEVTSQATTFVATVAAGYVVGKAIEGMEEWRAARKLAGLRRTKALQFETWQKGEDFCRNLFGGTKRAERFVFNGQSYTRSIDCFEVRGGFKIAHEAKVGFQRLSNPRIAIELVKDEGIIANEIADKVVWHFFRNATNGNMGPDAKLLKALQDLWAKYPRKFDFIIYDGNAP